MNKSNYYKYGGAVFILLMAIFMYVVSFNKMRDYTLMVNHTHEVMVGFEKLANDMKSAQMLASVGKKNRNEAIYDLYRTDANNIPVDFKNLDTLVRDNPRQARRVALLAANFSAFILQGNRMAGHDSTIQLHSNGQFKNLLLIQRLIDDGIRDETALLSKRKTEFQTFLVSTNVLSVLFVVTSLIVILATTVSTARESKKRYEVERFLEAVINTSQHGIVTYQSIRDEQNKVVNFKVSFANEAIARQIGKTPQEMIGKTLTEISNANGINERMERYIRVVETGERDEMEVSLMVKRKKITLDIILAKLNDGFTVTSYNITALKNSQLELEEKLLQLESTNAELEQFAYVASHDLQEPLRKIKTFASLINERFNEPSAAFAKVYLNKVIESADRMSHLINDLLNLSDLSKRHDAFVETDLADVIKYVLVDFDLILEEKNAVVTYSNMPVLQAITSQMNQLFYNLLNNALKFAKTDEPPKIDIECTVLTREEVTANSLDHEITYHRITVRDNGIGFKPEYADKIFNIFQRLNNRKLYSGSGIGLAICRKIVLNHHGMIRAEGEDGHGAQFHVILPAVQKEIEE